MRNALKLAVVLLLTFTMTLIVLEAAARAKSDRALSGRIFQDRIVIKFAPGGLEQKKSASRFDGTATALFESEGIAELVPVFLPNRRRTATGLGTTRDVSDIYYAYLNAGVSPMALVEQFRQDPRVVYAEPLYKHRLYESPNDPLFSDQTHYIVINAELAWDIVKGSSGDVVIAIVDGGTDTDHPDIQANLWVNPDEIPGNGIDDDNNGFIDDVNGWNFANDSGDPSGLTQTPSAADHGTIVGGIVSAVSDNNNGVAGTSWNAKLMPLNTVDPDEDLIIKFGYDGLLYAIENGANVVNMSWGRPGPPSVFELDLIEMANDLGVAMVASAGNAGNSVPNYPAAYPHVLSVASTDLIDSKAGFSNFGAWVDLAAPGVGILSTLDGDAFGELSGTSFSAPMVAGVVALVKTQHPDWLGIQASQQVRVTADNIDALNPQFAGLLGKGRLNAFAAVSAASPSVRIENITINDSDGDGVLEAGENATLTIEFTNYLAPVSNLILNMSSASSSVNILDGQVVIAALGTLEKTTADFVVFVSASAAANQFVEFTVSMTAAGYQDLQGFGITVAPNFRNIQTNNIRTTVTSNGRIGFANSNVQANGSGFFFKSSSNLLFEGAIIAGNNPLRISDAARGTLLGGFLTYNEDFAVVAGEELHFRTSNLITDEESVVVLADTRTGTPIGIRVTQESFALSAPPNDDFIILRYTVLNESGDNLQNFHFGLFFDWDVAFRLGDEFNNTAGFDAGRRLGYIHFDTLYVGVALLTTNSDISYRAIDNNSPTFGVNDGFTDSEKWQAISSRIQTTGISDKDVSHVIAAGPFNFADGDSVVIGFALLGGEGFNDLLANTDAAKNLWDTRIVTSVEKLPGSALPSTFSLQQNYPNPFNPETRIRFDIPATIHGAASVRLVIYNIAGQLVRVVLDEERPAGSYESTWDGKNSAGIQAPSGTYFYKITAGDFVETKKMLLLK